MKANELRIGNKVIAYGEEIEISASDFAVLVMYEAKNEHHPYNPIPITEEWLLKFGFKKKGEWMCIDFNPRMGIRFYNGNSAECDITKDDKYIAFKAGHIKYVHQLQNLYFALTGQELTFKK